MKTIEQHREFLREMLKNLKDELNFCTWHSPEYIGYLMMVERFINEDK